MAKQKKLQTKAKDLQNKNKPSIAVNNIKRGKDQIEFYNSEPEGEEFEEIP